MMEFLIGNPGQGMGDLPGTAVPPGIWEWTAQVEDFDKPGGLLYNLMGTKQNRFERMFEDGSRTQP